MKWIVLLIVLSFAILAGCTTVTTKEPQTEPGQKTAIFAGGCFWCMEAPFEAEEGITEVVVGYTGGDVPDPSYEEVITGQTGHRESVMITFDPKVVSYERLLEIYFWQIDPTDPDGQFADKGHHYTTAVYYFDESQKKAAQEKIKSIDESDLFDRPVVTEVLPAKPFYLAENYHQDYYKKAPVQYNSYATLSGRKGFIKKVWGQK